MARLTLSQKQQRLLVFLGGVLKPRVFTRVRERGFSEAMHARGLDLIRTTLRSRQAAREQPDLEPLEDLQRSWFPVVDAGGDPVRAHNDRSTATSARSVGVS